MMGKQISKAFTTIGAGVLKCREYPASIGRKLEGCIGITTYVLS